MTLPRRASTVVLILAIVAALGVVCTFGFTNSEDEGLITTNPNLNPPTLHGLWNHWRAPHVYLYIPMTYTTWWLLAVIGQVHTPDENGAMLNPWLFHAANLLMHAITCVLVLNLLRRLIGKEIPALLGALLFALHPIQVEAVAWTTGMKDVLCGAFSFGTLLLYVRSIQSDDEPHAGAERSAAPDRSDSSDGGPGRRCALPRRGGGNYWIATFLLLCALLSKPAACVIPLMALIIETLILDRDLRSSLRSLLAWFALTVPFLILAPLIQPAHDVTPAPLWSRPLIAGDALAFYLWKIVWPFGLTVDYARSPRAVLATGVVYWSWLIPAAVAVVLLVKHRRPLIAAALLFVAGLLPVLGFTTFLFQRYSTVADRFVYLSMFGIAFALAWAIAQFSARQLIAACAVVLLLLGIRSTMQALTWRNRRTLYGHAVQVSPHSATAHSNWGIVLSSDGDIEGAEAQYRRAIQLDPDLLAAHYNLAGILRAQGRMEELERERRIVEQIKAKLPAAATSPSQ